MPFHLFPNLEIWDKNSQIYLIEEFHLFNLYSFHKLKLVLHRASMQYYKDLLIKSGFHVEYIESNQKESKVEILIEKWQNENKTIPFNTISYLYRVLGGDHSP